MPVYSPIASGEIVQGLATTLGGSRAPTTYERTGLKHFATGDAELGASFLNDRFVDGSWVEGGGASGPSEDHIGEVGGNGSYAAASFTRPGDTTGYTAKDAVANSTGVPAALTFTNLAREASGTGYVVKARLATDQSACTTKMRLHLFRTSPTPINDNAPYTQLWANRALGLGSIDFDALQTEGSGSTSAYAVNRDVRLHYSCDGSDRNLYGLLETIDPFTPASGQGFYVELSAENN